MESGRMESSLVTSGGGYAAPALVGFTCYAEQAFAENGPGP